MLTVSHMVVPFGVKIKLRKEHTKTPTPGHDLSSGDSTRTTLDDVADN